MKKRRGNLAAVGNSWLLSTTESALITNTHILIFLLTVPFNFMEKKSFSKTALYISESFSGI
jgi:hypothetical protein